MKKTLLTVIFLMISCFGFSQQFAISNTTTRNITCTIYVYGTTSPNNTCATLLHTTKTVNAGSLFAVFDFTSPMLTWLDASNTMASTSSLGDPVFVRMDYRYTCALGTLSDKLSNTLCDAGNFTTSTTCGSTTITATLTQTGTFANVSFN